MYHRWDKTLREYLIRELRHSYAREPLEKYVWNGGFGKMVDIFDDFDWPVRNYSYFSKLEALQLIINVYKHGNGRSLTDLADRYPEYVVDPLSKCAGMEGFEIEPDHSWLSVSSEQFQQFCDAVREFWTSMPE